MCENINIKWYDKISYFYDFITLLFYRSARIKLINSLSIKENDRILIIIVNCVAKAEITRDAEFYAKGLVTDYKPIDKFFFQSIYVSRGTK